MKPFKTHVEQVQILQNRGLIVQDIPAVIKILERENYYNLINGYKELFLESPKNSTVEETYRIGTTFEEIFSLYSFDRSLRN